MTSKDERTLARLQVKRETLFRRVQLLYDASKLLNKDFTNKTNLNNFKIRYSTLESTNLEFRNVVEEIIELEQELKPDQVPSYAHYDAHQDLWDQIEWVASRIPKSEAPPSNISHDSHHIRLPKIDLMKFSGEDLSLWPLFYENFKNLIHLKPQFSTTEKLQYLLGSLQGKALKSIASVEALPDNYDIIWKLLVDSYHDRKYLATLYLEKLLNFSPVFNNQAKTLQTFLETFDTNVHALKRLKLDDLSDYILTYLAMSKLPQETVSAFELVRADKEIPTYEELIKFVRQQSKIVVKFEKTRPRISSGTINGSNSNFKNSKTFVTKNDNISNNRSNCVACNKSFHLLIECKLFKEFNPERRFRTIKENNLCINCFSGKHKVSSCPSKFTCTICKYKHHTLLHRNIISENTNQIKNAECKPNYLECNVIDNSSGQESVGASSASTSNVLTHSLCTVNKNKRQTVVLLSTAIVQVVDKWNKVQTIRFLIDSASMSNLITIDCCRILGLPYSKLFASVIGIGGVSKALKGKTNLTIQSRIDPMYKYPLEVLIVDKITDTLPDVSVDTNSLEHLKFLPLADPNYHLPGIVHGILGAAMLAEIMGSHKVSGPAGTPTALQSTLGYVVVGPAPSVSIRKEDQAYCTFLTLDSFETNDVDYITDNSSSNPPTEDIICENFFLETYGRDATGRYSVALPFKSDPSNLGDSFSLARKRLLLLEKRLERSPELKMTYHSILQDYLDQGHISIVPNSQLNVPSYYIPHHCIFKPDSTSTPCRIVFDASMRTADNSLSLNDILYTGPKLQNNLVTLLLNFRLHPIAVTADIKQMYRMIQIIKPHRQYQRILWRFKSSDPVTVYQLNTVTFGIKSSPFLSLRTVKQLAIDEGDSYPYAINHVNHNMYMDDYVCSIPSVDEAIVAHSQLVKLFKAGGFNLVKWASNSAELLSQTPDHLKLSETVEFNKHTLKILGLQWNPVDDMFTFRINIEPVDCTKRNMLSVVARIFDPLNFLAPVTLFIKLLIKKLWEDKLEWDQIAPNQTKDLWFQFQKELPLLNNIEIPRHLLIFGDTPVTLIGFCDASPVAYGCVIFIRTVQADSIVKVSLLIAQSKVSPTHNVTLPRLELCAAVLLSKCIAFVQDTYCSRIDQIYALSDSMITLSWINSSTQKWKAYVSNRVSQIQAKVPSSNWYFVPGKENAADCASRSLTPSMLLKNSSWFVGPQWLLLNPSEWPIKNCVENRASALISEEKILHVASEKDCTPLYHLINYFSSWLKMLHATVYVLRFLKILPRGKSICKSDLELAENYLIREVQKTHFGVDYSLLSQDKALLRSNLRTLNPFMNDKIIRVGGRLANSSLNFEQKHPILLPKSDPFVDKLIDYYHKIHHHTGPYLLQAILRQNNYWILSSRNIIRQRVWKCNHCFKINPKFNAPIMSDLPYVRVNQAKAFSHTGVDYTGAYNITLSRNRGVKSQKAYVCVFICLCTKAIHLELASDLSSNTFISAFRRFISRRGDCNTLYSDLGTNFVGAKNQLDDIYRLLQSNEYKTAFQSELNSNKIEWKFNPPSAPHFGGIWESNVKSVKSHLTRVIGTQILSFEEFSTVLAQVEALLNSRPLCVLSNDPSDLTALTPAHFLYGSPLNSLHSPNVVNENINRLNRHKLLDAMVQSFWKRWHLEYLTSLQTRQKWNQSASSSIKVGTIVVIKHDNLPPLQWPLGVVVKVFPGKDNVIRVVSVKTKNNIYIRPVVKLCPLPTQ